MKNGLNLFVMSVDDAIRWYKPQTEEESYLVDLLTQTSSNTAKELQDEVDDLMDKIEILEDDNSRLECDNVDLNDENIQLKRLNARLQTRVSDLENQILEELDN